MDDDVETYVNLQNLLLTMNDEKDINEIYKFIKLKKLINFSKEKTILIMNIIASVVYSHQNLMKNAISLLQKFKKIDIILSDIYRYGHYENTINQINIIILLLLLSGKFFKSNTFQYLSPDQNEFIMSFYKYHDKIPIYKAIINDDIDCFQRLIYKNNIDLDEKISFPNFKIYKLLKSATLLEYSAFFGSIKCFKFCMMNAKKIDFYDLLEYAIAGGNIDIIHMTEIQSNDSTIKENNKLLDIAILYMRNELIEYIIDVYNVECNFNNFYICYRSLNLSAFALLYELIDSKYSESKNTIIESFGRLPCSDIFFNYFKKIGKLKNEEHFENYIFDEIEFDYDYDFYDSYFEDDEKEYDKNCIEKKIFYNNKFNHNKSKSHHSKMNKQIKRKSIKKRRIANKKALKYPE